MCAVSDVPGGQVVGLGSAQALALHFEAVDLAIRGGVQVESHGPQCPYLILLLFVMWGFALLLLSHNLVGRDLIAAGALLIVFALVVIVTCVALVRRKWRRGLLFGVELTAPAAEVVGRCRQNGLLVNTAGEKTVRFAPPLTVTAETPL